MSTDLVGIGPFDRIEAHKFFRLTFAAFSALWPVEFAKEMQIVYDRLDSADGLAMPVSDLALPPGAKAAVVDVLVRDVAVGLTAAEFAGKVNGLHFPVALTSLTPISAATAEAANADDERGALQEQLSDAARARDPFALMGNVGKYLRWLTIVFVLALVAYIIFKGSDLVRRAA